MVNQMISHSIYMAIGIIAVIMIISSVTNMKTEMESVDRNVKMNYVADIIYNKLTELNRLNVDSANFLIEGSYFVKLENNLITVSDSEKSVTREINLEMSGVAELPAYLTLADGEITITETATESSGLTEIKDSFEIIDTEVEPVPAPVPISPISMR